MKKLLAVMIVLLPLSAFALGGGGSHSAQQQSFSLTARTEGPILRAFSENAAIFIIHIDDVSYLQQAADDGFLDFDLFSLNLPNGRHPVKVTPTNAAGSGETVLFYLQITGKNPRLWQIVLDKASEKVNPDYKTYFSSDLAVYVVY